MSQPQYSRLWRKYTNLERELLERSESSSDVMEENINSDEQEEALQELMENNSHECNYSAVSDHVSSDSSDNFSAEEFEYSDNEEGEDQSAFPGILASWACKSKVSRQSLNELLIILRENGHPELPKDCRTLLKTPRRVPVMARCGGDYVYLGLEKNILKKLSECSDEMLNSLNDIEVLLNIDGLPLFKSSGAQLWPVLGLINEMSSFIVSLFHGQEKPIDNADFLSDLIQEMTELKNNGIDFNGKHFGFLVKGFSCDTPARQFVKSIKGHSGYYACERCQVKGERKDQRMTFSDSNNLPRNGTDFQRMLYLGSHQTGECPLIVTTVNCVKDFGLDYMHLVCLGVVRRLLIYYFIFILFDMISHVLAEFNGLMPSEMARQPRSLNHLRRWKATEFRQFLLYTGMIALKSIFKKENYLHFLTLVVALRIMLESDSDYRTYHLDYAKDLLRYFVGKSSEIYGPTFVVYNVHNLIHLHEDVIHFDTNLDNISCFPFENHLGVLKKFVKQANNPIAQVVKRCNELEEAGVNAKKLKEETKISISHKDKHFLMHSGNIACIVSSTMNSEYICDIIEKRHLDNYFTEPCQSSLVNVYYVRSSNLRKKRNVHSRKDFKRKMACLPVKNGFVFVALLHDIN